MNKTFNLVYDFWDEELNQPIPNGDITIESLVFRDSFRFFEYYLADLCYGDLNQKGYFDKDKIPVKTFKIDEVVKNPKEKYFYAISHAFINLWEMIPTKDEKKDIRLKKEIITDQIKDLLKTTNNFFIIFLYEHECDELRSLIRLKNYIIENDLDEKKFYVINNNLNIYNYKKIAKTNINVHSLRFIPQTSTKVLELFKPKFEINKDGKFFLCLNRGPKNHRLYILMYLKLSNLLEDTNWSFVPTWTHGIIHEHLYQVFGDTINNNTLSFIQNLKYKESEFEINMGNYDEENKYQWNFDGLPPMVLVPHRVMNYETTYVNIVTESCFFNSNSIHITEKSFVPFYFYQLPIIVGTHNHVKMMKDNYGLDFFDDLINHNYDNEKNDFKRINMIFKEIKRLHDNKDMVKEFYKNNQTRFENNRQLVLNNITYDGDYLFFKNLL